MALTKEMITANEGLKGMSEEQISAIVELSANDEDAVIGKRFGEAYRQLDSTIEKATGIPRDGAEKTYNYLERATKAYAAKFSDYDELKGQVDTLKAQNTALEEKIAKGGDDAIRQQLDAVTKELANTKVNYTEMREKYEASEATHAKALSDYKITSELERAKGELKFKTGINDAVKATLVEKVMETVRGMNPSFEDKNGVETLIFHNEDGSPINNEKNRLNPFTAKELLEREFRAMDLLEVQNTKGAGAKANLPKGGLISATTKSEADEEINKILTSKGLVRGTSDYQGEYDKMWAENKISELPM